MNVLEGSNTATGSERFEFPQKLEIIWCLWDMGLLNGEDRDALLDLVNIKFTTAAQGPIQKQVLIETLRMYNQNLKKEMIKKRRFVLAC